MILRILAAAGIIAAMMSCAMAQSAWYTPGGSGANGSVNMCLNSAGQAVPESSGECANGQQPKTYVSAGAGQYGLALTAATALTVPTGAVMAEICAEAQAVRYRDDGTAPTASVGIPIAAGACIQYVGPLADLKFIQEAASATLDVSYYK